MRYTVNYEGAFFTDDTDGFNCVETDRFEGAVDLLKILVSCGFEDAYLKDEEYQCTFRFDKRDNDFVWEG